MTRKGSEPSARVINADGVIEARGVKRMGSEADASQDKKSGTEHRVAIQVDARSAATHVHPDR